MNYFISCFFSFLLFAHCSALEDTLCTDENTTSVATLEGLPSSLVNQSVCAITGQYIDQSLDFILPGPEPLIFQRTYSSTTQKGNLGIGWNSNHCDWLAFNTGNYEEEYIWYCMLAQPSGARLFFKHKYDEKYKKSQKLSLNLMDLKGLTNGSRGEISGRTNPKNHQVFWYPKEESFKCLSGSSNSRTFRKKKNIPGYCLCRESKVNGSAFDYDHQADVFMHAKSIRCFNSKNNNTYSDMSIKYKPDLKNKRLFLTLDTSDKRKFDYEYFMYTFEEKIKETARGMNGEAVYTEKWEVNQFYLQRVVSPHKPIEKYQYTHSHTGKGFLISEKILPDHRTLAIKYYHPGDNFVSNQLGFVHVDEDDYRNDRVRTQSSPVGTTSKLIPTHRYLYNINVKKKSNGQKELRDGYTHFYDAYHHQTTYHYNEDSHLTSIKKYKGTSSHSLYSKENYIWGTSKDKGNLKAEFLTDAQNNIHHYRSYSYDDRGNILTNCLYGCLTGKKPSLLKLDDSKKPLPGCECDIKTYTYSNDGLNLLLSEKEVNGKKTENLYRKGTDILIAKFVIVNGKIKIREFFSYDENNVLIKKIRDDGSTYSEQNLNDVTERHVTIIEPQNKKPVGLPAKQSEFCLDLNTGLLLLQSKVISDYTPEGYLSYQEYYDANELLHHKMEWKYNDHGKVIEEVKTLGPDSERQIRLVTSKEYDDNDNLIIQKWPIPKHKIKNSYDFMNRLIKEEEFHPDGQVFATSHQYDHLNNCISTVDHYNQITELTYDDFSRVIAVHHPDLEDEKGEVVKPITYKEYDIAGNLIAITDAMGNVTVKDYNIRGQPIKIIYPDGTFERFIYRLDGKLVHKHERNGLKTHFTLDAFGRVIEEICYSIDDQQLKKTTNRYNAFHLTQSVDAEGLITDYSYDLAGRLEWIHKSSPKTQTVQATQHIYNSMGQLTEVREWFGDHEDEYRAAIKEYDLFGRVSEERLEDSSGNVIHYSRYEYDLNNNRIVEQHGDQITRTEFNLHNNPIKIINGLGHETHTSYNTRFLNGLGQYVLQTITTDPLGYQVVDTYDSAKRLVETLQYNPFGILISKETIHYDLNGNTCKVSGSIIDNQEIKEVISTLRTYEFDQMRSLIEAYGDVNQKTTFFKYNSLGQKSEMIKHDGIVLQYDYDEFGRLYTLSSTDGSISYQYEYDLNDAVTAIVDLNNQGRTERSYDPFGKLEYEIQSNGLRTDYAYDKSGRVRFVYLPDNTGIEYVYDAVDLKEIHRLKKGKRIYSHFNQSHNLTGQITQAKLAGENGELQYNYDQLGRCINISSNHFQQYIPHNGFDARGNLRTFYIQNDPYQFDYDDLKQLISEKGHTENTYRFDSLANRKEKNGEQHIHNALHQLIQKGEDYFKYDKNGNLIEQTLSGQIIHYEYDALDRLISITRDNEKTHYAYDGFNRRLSKKQAGKEDQLFLYLAQEELGKIEAGRLTEFRLLAKSQRSPMVAMELQDRLYVPNYDLSGNIVSLTDESSNLVEKYRYTVFGESEILSPTNELLQASIVANPWQYAGKRRDNESGLIAFGLRYYDTQLGRWITPDPAGFEDGPNLYAYVHNSPLMQFDQFGQFSIAAMSNIDYSLSQSYMQFSPYYEFGAYSPKHDDTVFQCNYEKCLSYTRPLYSFSSSHTEMASIYDINRSEIFNPKTNEPYWFRETNNYFGFCNGILNDSKEHLKSSIYAAKLANHNMIGVHSPTYGLKNDAIRYTLARAGVASETVSEILKCWTECFNANPNAHICWTCHSRGVVDTGNALKLFSPQLRQRITTIAVAPGSYISPHLCGSVTHLASKRDRAQEIRRKF